MQKNLALSNIFCYTYHMTFDALCIGSLTMDTFFIGGDIQHSIEQINQSERAFLFPVGDKITVESIVQHTGGGAANVASSLKKLGLDVGIISTIGMDNFAEIIMKELHEKDINTTHVQQITGENSSQSVVLMSDAGDRTVMHYKLTKGDILAPLRDKDTQAKMLYIGHIHESAGILNNEVLSWKERSSGAKIMWNPGKTQFKEGVMAHKNLLNKVHTLILNTEELELFIGTATEIKPAKDILKHTTIINTDAYPNTLHNHKSLVQKLLNIGVQQVIVTGGNQGAFLYSSNNNDTLYIPPSPIKPTSTLGAGDAFSAGVVGAAHYGLDAATQMRWGAANAEEVIQIFGAQEGQLSRAQMSQ